MSRILLVVSLHPIALGCHAIALGKLADEARRLVESDILGNIGDSAVGKAGQVVAGPLQAVGGQVLVR